MKRSKIALLLLAASCGESSPINEGSDHASAAPVGSQAPGTDAPLVPERLFLRVDLALNAEGEVAVEQAAGLRSAIRVPPISPTGDVLVLAYKDDELVGMDMARFTVRAREESSQIGAPKPTERTLRLNSTTALLPISAQPNRIVVQRADGTVAAEFAISAAASAASGLAVSEHALVASALYPHIRVLGPSDQRSIPPTFSALVGALVAPTAEDLDILERALARAAPGTLAGVRNVGFTTGIEGSTTWGVTLGPTVLLNVGRTARAQAASNASFPLYVLNHEFAHAYASLVDNTLDDEEWPFALASWTGPTARVAAEQIAALGLSQALAVTWHELHQTGVNLALAPDYTWNDTAARPASTAVEAGFATPYGSTDPEEDLAEFVAQVQIPEWTEDSGRLCQKLRQDTPETFPVTHAIAYAKLEFVRALELVSEDRYRTCIGGLSLSGPPGIHLRAADGSTSSFSGEVLGGRSMDMGKPVLTAIASQGEYQSLVQVEASQRGGLGLHRLDDHTGFFDVALGLNEFIAADMDDHAFLSESGLVLVTKIDQERLEGVLFMLTLRNAFFTTDVFPIGTFRVDRPRL